MSWIDFFRRDAFRHAGMQSVVIVLCCTLFLQMAAYLFISLKGRWSDNPARAVIVIDRLPTQNAYLRSTLPENQRMPMHTEEFRITNRDRSPIELAVQLPSCGCLSFERDGASIAADQWWLLESGDSSVIGMKFPLSSKTAADSTTGECLVTCRSPTTKSLRMRKRLSSRATVYNEIEADPSILQVLIGSKASAWEKHVIVTVVQPDNTEAIPPVIGLPNELSELLSVSIACDDAPESISGNLQKLTYSITIKPVESRGDPIALSAARSHALALSISLPSRSLSDSTASRASQIRIPIEVEDASQLDACELIDFGAITAKSMSTRTMLVATRDGGHLRISETAHDGSGELSINAKNEVATSSIIVNVTFQSSLTGIHKGTFELFPQGDEYQPLTVQYKAEVTQPISTAHPTGA